MSNWKPHETDNLLSREARTPYGERVKIVEVFQHRKVSVEHESGMRESWEFDMLNLIPIKPSTPVLDHSNDHFIGDRPACEAPEQKDTNVMVQVHVKDWQVQDVSKGVYDWRTVIMEAVKSGRFEVLGLEKEESK